MRRQTGDTSKVRLRGKVLKITQVEVMAGGVVVVEAAPVGEDERIERMRIAIRRVVGLVRKQAS